MCRFAVVFYGEVFLPRGKDVIFSSARDPALRWSCHRNVR